MAIRAFERGDLQSVARLVREVMATGSPDRTEGFERHLAALFLDHPWFDPEIPSLVSTDREGRVIGFIGSSVRRMRHRHRRIRLAVSGPLVVEPGSRMGSGTRNDAYAELVSSYWRPVYRTLRVRCRKSKEESEDLTRPSSST